MADHWRDDWSPVPAWFVRMGVADGIAIHHTATPAPPQSYDPAWLARVEQAEIAAGYNALAYHTVFFQDGSSAEARPYGAMGAATGGHNGHTIALCAAGYFHSPYDEQPTAALVASMGREVAALVEVGFLVPDFYVVWPHRDWTAGTQWATACCGDQFVPLVPTIDAISRGGLPPAQEVDDDMDIRYIVRTDPGDPATEQAHHYLRGDRLVVNWDGPIGAKHDDVFVTPEQFADVAAHLPPLAGGDVTVQGSTADQVAEEIGRRLTNG